MRYLYNQNNTLYNQSNIMSDTDSYTQYKVDSNDTKKLDIPDEISITLTYQMIRKPNISYLETLIYEKFSSIGQEDVSDVLKTEYPSYLKRDIKRSLKTLKHSLSTIPKSEKKKFMVKYNVENIIRRFMEDLYYGRVGE